MANWDELLLDLLTMIIKKVHIYEDFVAFGGVCRSWRSVAVKENFNQNLVSSSSRSVQPPWLMLSEKDVAETDVREFVNLSKGGMFKKKIELPEAREKWCIGSMGWLITIDKEGGMQLLHPLTRDMITLPHLRTYRFYEEEIELHGMAPMVYVCRATLSASPSATVDYAVMLILGTRSNLAFWKPGNTGWTLVETSYSGFCDVTYHKDNFYAANFDGQICMCDVRGPNPITVQIVGTLPSFLLLTDGQLYLAECYGDLLLVKKRVTYPNGGDQWDYMTSAFRICKAAAAAADDDDDDDSSTSLTKWQEINDLGETSIFVGHNTAIVVPSAAAAGVKPNCVYFTDDYVEAYSTANSSIGGKDMGIYNLGTRSIEPVYGGASFSQYCPPIWVSPSF